MTSTTSFNRSDNQDHSMLAGHHAALRLLGRPKLDPWDVNTERSYYDVQLLMPVEPQTATQSLLGDKSLPHEKS